jgi:beta-glucanase (GH16 family)
LALQKSTTGGSATGARLSTVRWLLYGRITLRMTGIALPGVVTTFITMSERKDEIDWEFVGGNVTEAQTNVFYKGIQEFNTHNTKEALPSRIDQPHTFTIDWTKDTLSWLIDGKVVRTVYRANATSPMVCFADKLYYMRSRSYDTDTTW